MKNIDYKLFIVVILLIIFGVIMISSVSVFQSYKVTSIHAASWLIKEPYNYFYLIRSISHIALSLVLMAIVIKTNYSFFERNSKYFLAGSIFLLILVLIKWERTKWATWWLFIPWVPFSIQPTEFLKISIIIFLAMMFKKYGHIIKDFKNWFLPFSFLMLVIVILVWAQPDFWTIMVLLPVTWIMFFYAGANKKHIASLWILWILLFSFVYSMWKYWDKPEDFNRLWYIKQRVDNFFKSNEELFKSKEDNNKTHQTKQWLITIWSWGFSWKWFWQSIQKFWHLPEVQWDFIFAVIIEELGFRWWLILILMYLYIWYRWFYIAHNVKDKFWKYAALWITSWILFQTFINIWVNLNIVPLTWVTLPFVSYWWSSLLALSAWVWILLSISRHIEEKPAYARMSKNKFIF